jgi:Tfp pilus assembly protein PilN
MVLGRQSLNFRIGNRYKDGSCVIDVCGLGDREFFPCLVRISGMVEILYVIALDRYLLKSPINEIRQQITLLEASSLFAIDE